MKKFLISTLVILFLLALATGMSRSRSSQCPNFSTANIQVGSTTFTVGQATTANQQARGLGGCPHVPDRSGLYFPYYPPQTASFWMHGMLIPIDIIWIKEGTVVGIEANVPPPANPITTDIPTYPSPGKITGVLEVAAGSAQKYGISIDDPAILTDKR